jgi:hypothetical protein
MERLIRSGTGGSGKGGLPDGMETEGSSTGRDAVAGGSSLKPPKERSESVTNHRKSTSASLTENFKTADINRIDDHVFLQPFDRNHPRHDPVGPLGSASLKSNASSAGGAWGSTMPPAYSIIRATKFKALGAGRFGGLCGLERRDGTDRLLQGGLGGSRR